MSKVRQRYHPVADIKTLSCLQTCNNGFVRWALARSGTTKWLDVAQRPPLQTTHRELLSEDGKRRRSHLLKVVSRNLPLSCDLQRRLHIERGVLVRAMEIFCLQARESDSEELSRLTRAHLPQGTAKHAVSNRVQRSPYRGHYGHDRSHRRVGLQHVREVASGVKLEKEAGEHALGMRQLVSVGLCAALKSLNAGCRYGASRVIVSNPCDYILQAHRPSAGITSQVQW